MAAGFIYLPIVDVNNGSRITKQCFWSTDGTANGNLTPVNFGQRVAFSQGNLDQPSLNYGTARWGIGAPFSIQTPFVDGEVVTVALVIKALGAQVTTNGALLVSLFSAQPTAGFADAAVSALVAADSAKCFTQLAASMTGDVSGNYSLSLTGRRMPVDPTGKIWVAVQVTTAHVLTQANVMKYEAAVTG